MPQTQPPVMELPITSEHYEQILALLRRDGRWAKDPREPVVRLYVPDTADDILLTYDYFIFVGLEKIGTISAEYRHRTTCVNPEASCANAILKTIFKAVVYYTNPFDQRTNVYFFKTADFYSEKIEICGTAHNVTPGSDFLNHEIECFFKLYP